MELMTPTPEALTRLMPFPELPKISRLCKLKLRDPAGVFWIAVPPAPALNKFSADTSLLFARVTMLPAGFVT